MSLWSQLIEVPTLWAAWQRVRANNGGAGGDGVGQLAFARSAGPRIERLAKQLASGHYTPGPHRPVQIPKKDGGHRILSIPCIIDRVAQTAAAGLLGPVLDPQFEKSSHAYRPGRGVTTAVRAVLRHRRNGYRWTAEGDVEQCFDEIPHDILLDRLDEAAGDPRLTDLIALWLENYAPEGVGIAQGSPISPILCNLHLDAVDEAISGHGVRLVRYADDFVLLTKKASEAEQALEDMSAALRMHGLELNPEKSRIVGSDQALRFLGHIFVRSMAWKEVVAEDDLPPLPDAPTEDILAQWAGAQDAERNEALAKPEEFRPSRLRTMHIVEPGALLSVRNKSFVVLGPEVINDAGERKRHGQVLEHAKRIDRIELGPNTRADWDAMQLAMTCDVPLAVVDGYGQTSGWLTHPADLRARRIMAQARYLADDDRRNKLATAIVRGRIRNQQKRVRKLNISRHDARLTRIAVDLRRAGKRLPEVVTPSVALGHEGNAGALYWQAIAHCIPLEFDFNNRDRRPPPDPVNACLGYLYALLEREVRVAIQRAGLQPGLGALHVARDDGDALIYDMMEAFRTATSETILMGLIARKAIRPDMFVVRELHLPDGKIVQDCRIELSARRKLIRAHENLMARTVSSKRSKKKVLWRALLEEEARALTDLFVGKATEFEPFVIHK